VSATPPSRTWEHAPRAHLTRDAARNEVALRRPSG
jgi:hypothetical protein